MHRSTYTRIAVPKLQAIGLLRNSLSRNVLPATARGMANATPRKPRVVVIGCGWGGFRFAQDIDKKAFDVLLVSPRNHFLFTPLLPSTAVGTLEFRCIQEPVRTIPGLNYLQASCNSIDFDKKEIQCTEAFKYDTVPLSYDYLVLAPGSETNTFQVPGVEDNPRVFFLKQLDQARAIRNKLIESFERASLPSVDPAERDRLLTFIVVGGGPTNIEFAAELYDFLQFDVARSYADLTPYVKVMVVEASGHILGSFKSSLGKYVEKLFRKRRIEVRTGVTVQAVEDGCSMVLDDGSRLPFGLMVWSTGIKQVPMILRLGEQKQVAQAPGGRLLVDSQLRLLRPSSSADIAAEVDASVYAMGDCACDSTHPLPALAQVAAQQGKYLADVFNNHHVTTPTTVMHSSSSRHSMVPAFKYMHLGSMASVGDWKGVVDTPNISK